MKTQAFTFPYQWDVIMQAFHKSAGNLSKFLQVSQNNAEKNIFKQEFSFRDKGTVPDYLFYGILFHCLERVFGVSEEQVREKTRKRHIVCVRQAFFYFSREYFGLRISYAELGKIFGKDHATAIHGIRVQNNLMETDPSYREKMGQMYGCLNLNLQGFEILPYYDVLKFLSLYSKAHPDKKSKVAQLRKTILDQIFQVKFISKKDLEKLLET